MKFKGALDQLSVKARRILCAPGPVNDSLFLFATPRRTR
jgi:hypothetical protein